ncbi:hypothetical protein [Stappia sp. ES.058]|nr:hypothetical protein [Stappia sp. ES.058]SDU20572.1 hypothetical protein SAMN05428979_2270 [Stappia sp. ES.058]
MSIEKKKTDARQGNTSTANARVLGISLGLGAAILLVVTFWFVY